MDTPGMKRVFMFVGTKALGELRLAKGVLNMATGTFEAFNAENATLTKQFLPYATGTDKETIAAFELPFYITGVRTRVSQFPDPDTGEDKNEILYDIEMDTTHEGYKYASRNKDLKTGYCLTLSENVFRVKLNEQVIQPAIDAGTPMRARLVKRGRAWSFADAPLNK